MNRIAEFMAARELKADQLIAVARLPLSRPQLSNIINGHVLPTAPVLMAICEALDTAPCELYELKTIDLKRVQELWDKRYSSGKKHWYGNREARARLKEAEWVRLRYVMAQRGHKDFGVFLRSLIDAEYAALRLSEAEEPNLQWGA